MLLYLTAKAFLRVLKFVPKINFMPAAKDNSYALRLFPGCKIYTTAEIVLVESGKYVFTREKDGSTSWEELQMATK